MRPMDANTAAALTGSRQGDDVAVWLWYDGALVRKDRLPVTDWSINWNGGEKVGVQGELSMSIADPDGQLGPWLYEDPLGVGGSRLQVFYQVGGAGTIDLGWYRIVGNDTKESWSFRTIREDGFVDPDADTGVNKRVIVVPNGSQVRITALELTSEIDSDEFLAPEQPAGGTPTVVSEITRLVGDTVPVIFSPGFPDLSVPRDIVWEDNRLEAVMDLLSTAGATHRMTGAGALECFVKDPTPVFECVGGDTGVLIDPSRSQSVNQVYNIGVVTSTMKQEGADGRELDVPIVGSYEVTSGPLRVGGPFGRRVIRQNNPLMNTQFKADEAAKTLVLNRLSAQTTDIRVQCLINPGVQVHDYAIVGQPVVDGRQVPLLGEVIDIGMGGTDTGPKAMTLTVRCLQSDVAAAMKGHSIADKFTGNPPPLTYDNINPLRTLDQMAQESDQVRG